MSSEQNIYQFTPTFLYIKQHLVTGKCYLGKTIRHNPEKYLGSGSYWKNHISKYGKDHVVTLWYCLFTDKASLVECASALSKLYDIVNSPIWANQMDETGLGGGVIGQCKNMVTVKDKNGNCFKVKLDDPRYLSGEVVHNLTGMKMSSQTKTFMSETRRGNLNANAKTVKVFDDLGNMQYEFFGTWTSFTSKQLNLPKGLLSVSLSRNGEPITPIHKKWEKFKGWFATIT
jgi:hypothetical protein